MTQILLTAHSERAVDFSVSRLLDDSGVMAHAALSLANPRFPSSHRLDTSAGS